MSPMTGLPLVHTTLVPSHTLRKAIEDWDEARCRPIRRSELSPAEFDQSTLIGRGSFKEVGSNFTFEESWVSHCSPVHDADEKTIHMRRPTGLLCGERLIVPSCDV